MKATIESIEDEVADEFALFDDPMERYEYIIDIGKKMADMDERYKTDEFLVKGCQSKVWLRAYAEGDRIFFEADSNTAITKGIVALLVRVLSGQPATGIKNAGLHFIDRIQLRSHLSSQRSNGLSAMILKMKQYAEVLG